MSTRVPLRTIVEKEVVFAPLALDALTARIAGEAGFKAVYISGGALGYAHAISEALLTLSDVADAARHLVARSEIAVIADAGVGFGDAVHMTRTIAELETAGVSAVEIEDQVAPKRVSHHRGIEHLIPAADMATKVEIAVRARTSEDLLIIARTGAISNESFEHAVQRTHLYTEAGADMVMAMPTTERQWIELPRQVNAPLATITSLDARSKSEWEALGWSLVIDPMTAQVASVDAVKSIYDRFMENGSTGLARDHVAKKYRELANLAGLDSYYAIEDATTEQVRGDEHPRRE